MLKIRECHKLKTWPQYFEEVSSGNKPFEIRKDDRNFQVGDTLMLMEWSPEEKNYTGKFLNCRITYKLEGGQFGIEKGYCGLGIKLIEDGEVLQKSKGMPCVTCEVCHVSAPFIKTETGHRCLKHIDETSYDKE